MRRAQIKVEGNRAWCDEISDIVVADSQEEAVRIIHQRIRHLLGTEVLIVFPYMGQDFSPRWEDIRFKPPPKEDEFEDMQKAYEFPKDKEIL